MTTLTASAVTLLVFSSPPPALAQPSLDRPTQDEIFYQIMPIAWRDSNNDTSTGVVTRFGDFNGLTASLDYLTGLGVTSVWLNPIHPTPAYHGYQHGPIDQVNSRFGTRAEFLNLVNQAHLRGVKVNLDAVVYGINRSNTYSPYFSSAFNNPASPYDTWIAFTNTANTQYLGSTYITWNGASVQHVHWDLRTPAVRDLVINWCRGWLDPNNDGDTSDGIDGFRLDHVWVQYGSGPDGWGYNLDDFWVPWKAALEAVKPTVFSVVEQADWGLTGAEFIPPHDAAFTKPFEFAARDAIRAEQAGGLYSAMATAVNAAPSTANGTFLAIIGDHDVDRLSSNLGAIAGRDRTAAAVLLTQPFPPVIYMGDELGMRGTKASYGSDADDIPMREPFKWNAVAGPPMSNYHVLNSQAYTNRFARDNDGRSVQEQQGVAGSLLETYRSLITTRRNSVALRRGTYTPVTCTNSRVWSFVRHHADQTVLVMINLGSSTASGSLNLSSMTVAGGSTTPVDLQTGGTLATPITTANRAAYPISIPAYSWRIVQAGITPPPPPPSPPSDLDGLNLPADSIPLLATATQTTPTSLGDNVGELNRMTVRENLAGLRVAITGNLPTDGTALVLLVDADGTTSEGGTGQTTLATGALSPPPGGLQQLNGTILDTGFQPERFFFINGSGGTIYADHVAIPTPGTAAKTYRGQGRINDGDGLLTGGANPNHLAVAINNSNTLGVTAASATGAANGASGFELLIPWAELGLPAPPTSPAQRACRTIRLSAFLVRTNGTISSQVLPGTNSAVAVELGLAPDFRAVPGDQFLTVTLNPLDLDASGAADADDLFAFLGLWFAAPPGAPCPTAAPFTCAADWNGSGVIDADDLFAYLTDWFIGAGGDGPGSPCP